MRKRSRISFVCLRLTCVQWDLDSVSLFLPGILFGIRLITHTNLYFGLHSWLCFHEQKQTQCHSHVCQCWGCITLQAYFCHLNMWNDGGPGRSYVIWYPCSWRHESYPIKDLAFWGEDFTFSFGTKVSRFNIVSRKEMKPNYVSSPRKQGPPQALRPTCCAHSMGLSTAKPQIFKWWLWIFNDGIPHLSPPFPSTWLSTSSGASLCWVLGF